MNASIRIIAVFALFGCIAAAPSDWYVGFPEDDVSVQRGRIVSGKNADEHAAPYIVSIKDGAKGAHICGGSILTKNTILTAAHCLKADLLVVAGLYDRKNETATQVIKVKNYIGHEKYKGGAAPYDIGVLHLAEPIRFVEGEIEPIALPQSDAKPSGEVQLYGWGRTAPNSYDLPRILQVVTTDLLTNDECHAQLPEKKQKELHDTNICTSSRNQHISSCNADSGGPLVQSDSVSSKPTLVGLVSWGVLPCGKLNKPSVYTQISSHLQWIKINTRK